MSSSTTMKNISFLVMFLWCISWTSAFFLNWGATEPPPPKVSQPQWPITAYYQSRYLPPPPSYTITGNDNTGMPMQIPAIPIQVPLKAQLAPAANIHNVQLVPCLCPITPDYEYDSKLTDASLYVNQQGQMMAAQPQVQQLQQLQQLQQVQVQQQLNNGQ